MNLSLSLKKRQESNIKKRVDEGEKFCLVLSKYSGFCYGVKRAVDIAKEVLDASKGDVYSIGPLIHNPQEVRALEEKGLKKADSYESIKKGTVIIRSHGVSPSVREELERKKLKVIDATCPYVEKVQKLGQKLYSEGYKVVIVGDSTHPEVKGILESVGDSAYVVSSAEEAMKIGCHKRIGIIEQTTQRVENVKKVMDILFHKTTELKVHNTICNATYNRQKEARRIAEEVDLMFIVGGRNSSNTVKLAKTCMECNPETYQIETEKDIKAQWLRNKKKVGIATGASTPEWILKKVIKYLISKRGKFCGKH